MPAIAIHINQRLRHRISRSSIGADQEFGQHRLHKPAEGQQFRPPPNNKKIARPQNGRNYPGRMKMSDPVYKVVDVVGTSEQSISKAIENAIAKASSTLRNLGWFEVG